MAEETRAVLRGGGLDGPCVDLLGHCQALLGPASPRPFRHLCISSMRAGYTGHTSETRSLRRGRWLASGISNGTHANTVACNRVTRRVHEPTIA